MALSFGYRDVATQRTWTATSPVSSTSPITSIVMASQREEWFRGSR